jgi:hypothetical protein
MVPISRRYDDDSCNPMKLNDVSHDDFLRGRAGAPTWRDTLLVWTVVQLDNGLLKYSGDLRKRPAPQDLYRRFAQLHTAPDERIRSFTNRYGPLRAGSAVEPVKAWHAEASVARAIIRLATRFKNTQTRRVDDWKVLVEHKLLPGHHPGDPKLDRLVLASCVNAWFSRLKDMSILEAMDGRFRYRLSEPSALGTTILQLARVLAEDDEQVRCAACGSLVDRERMGGRGDRRYCDACRDLKRARRDASRDYRQRNRLPRLWVKALRQRSERRAVVQSIPDRQEATANTMAGEICTAVDEWARVIKKPWRAAMPIILELPAVSRCQLEEWVACFREQFTSRVRDLGFRSIVFIVGNGKSLMKVEWS